MISSTHNPEIIAPVDSKDAEIDIQLSKTGNNAKNDPNTPHGNNKKIDIEKAIKLRKNGLTYQEIANYFNCAKPSVHEILKRHMPDDINLTEYKQNRADRFAKTGARLLYSLTDEDIKKMSGLQRITGVGILYDKERLEEFKPTSIVFGLHATPETLEAYGKAAIVINQSRLTDAKKEELEAVTADSDNYEEIGVSD